MNAKVDLSMDDIRHHDNTAWFHPWEYLAESGLSDRTIITHAEGIYVYDENGRRLIDGPGGMWCTQVGYGRQEMVTAIADQASRLAYMNPFALTSEPSARLAAKLASLAPGDLNHVFFTTCGSTAVDTALRFVHFYNNVRGRPHKKHIISRENAYHGSTFLCATVTAKDGDKNWFDVDRRYAHILPTVKLIDRPAGMSEQAFCDAKVNDLEAKILELGPENVGAFIAEPIQASGGVIVPPDGYLRRCREICTRYDVLYISDEVVTAFGRLGHWFASEEVFDVVPDIITCAKGLTSGYLPMGACLISDRLFKEISGDNSRGASFGHGYTYSGHPVCAAAALKSIELIEQEQLLDNVRDLGPYFQRRMRELSSIPLVREVRGMGLVGCVECTVKEIDHEHEVAAYEFDCNLGARIDLHCHEMGLMVRPIVNKCVFSPPLIINKEQIDEMVNILGEAIRRTQKDVQRELKIKFS